MSTFRTTLINWCRVIRNHVYRRIVVIVVIVVSILLKREDTKKHNVVSWKTIRKMNELQVEKNESAEGPGRMGNPFRTMGNWKQCT